MIVSKALRNIRQKIDFVAVPVSPVLLWWQYGYETIGAGRTDLSTTPALAYAIGSSLGSQFTDDDWNTLISANTGTSLTAMRTYALANRPALVMNPAVIIAGTPIVRIREEYDGRYLLLEDLQTQFTSAVQFDRIYIMINNSSAAVAVSTLVFTVVEITAQELIAMGLSLTLNANSSYSFPTGLTNQLRIKLSEDA